MGEVLEPEEVAFEQSHEHISVAERFFGPQEPPWRFACMYLHIS